MSFPEFIPEKLLKKEYYLNKLPVYFRTATGIEKRIEYAVAFLKEYSDALRDFYFNYDNVIRATSIEVEASENKYKALKKKYEENKDIFDIFIDILAESYGIYDSIALPWIQSSVTLSIKYGTDLTKDITFNKPDGTYIVTLTKWQKLMLINRAILLNGYDSSTSALLAYAKSLNDSFAVNVRYSVSGPHQVSSYIDKSSNGLQAVNDISWSDTFAENAKRTTFGGTRSIYALTYSDNADDPVNPYAAYAFGMLLLTQNDYFILKSVGVNYRSVSIFTSTLGKFNENDTPSTYLNETAFINNRFNFGTTQLTPNEDKEFTVITNDDAQLTMKYSDTNANYELVNESGYTSITTFNQKAHDVGFKEDGASGVNYSLGAVWQ